MLMYFLQTLWLERTTIYTKFTFPGILCWFEATAIDMVCFVCCSFESLFCAFFFFLLIRPVKEAVVVKSLVLGIMFLSLAGIPHSRNCERLVQVRDCGIVWVHDVTAAMLVSQTGN